MISSCRTLALLRMDPRLGYIDTASALLEPDGTLRDDVFIFDGLHMNATGYAAWTEVVRPVIESAYRRLSPLIISGVDQTRRAIEPFISPGQPSSLVNDLAVQRSPWLESRPDR
jgi:hypothetical protein